MMTIARPIYLTTPEEVAFDESCGMKLWYRKYQNGGGITPKEEMLKNEMLEATRSDLRILSQMTDITVPVIQEQIDYILTGIPHDQAGDLRAKELLYRRLGWFAAFAIYMEPGIRRMHDTIPLEEEIDLDRSPLIIRLKTGRLLRHKAGYQVEHRFYVPAIAATERWRAQWEWNILPHLNLLAAREAQEHQVHFGRIVGLNVGITPSIPDGKLHHPYVYGYHNKDTGEWTHQFKMSDDTAWVQRPIWEAPFSISTWVQKCGQTVAENQFPMSPRVPYNHTMVQKWLDRRLYRERNIQPLKIGCKENNSLRNIHFPSITAECAPLHAPHCAFKDLCWSEQFMRDALIKTQFTANLPVLLTQVVEEFPSYPSDKPTTFPVRQTLSEMLEQSMQEARMEEEGGNRGEHSMPRVIDITPLSSTHSVAQLAPLPVVIPTTLEMFPGVI